MTLHPSKTKTASEKTCLKSEKKRGIKNRNHFFALFKEREFIKIVNLKKRRRVFKRSKDTFVSNVFFLINRINKYPLCLVSSLSLRGEILYLIEV